MKSISKRALEKQLDTIFSQHIRLLNSDDEGYCICCTCGHGYFWAEITNGHFINCWEMATRWNEKNCHPQCGQCNSGLGGNLDKYEEWLKERYGKAHPDILRVLSKQFARTNISELEILISFYKNSVKRLKKAKGFS